MKNFKFKIDGNTYEVAVEEKDANLAEVSVNGKTFSIEMESKAAAPAALKAVAAPAKAAAPKAKPAVAPAAAAPAKPAAGAAAVTAPIPGTVFKILTNAGAKVKKGETLLVLEAMKMENNILAAKDGVVKAVLVSVGQSVLQGDVLVDVE